MTGDVQEDLGQSVRARRSWRAAAEIFSELGGPG
jgi:hypothetical protein